MTSFRQKGIDIPERIPYEYKGTCPSCGKSYVLDNPNVTYDDMLISCPCGQQFELKRYPENIYSQWDVYRVSWRFKYPRSKDLKLESRAKSLMKFLEEKGATDIRVEIVHKVIWQVGFCFSCGSPNSKVIVSPGSPDWQSLVCADCGQNFMSVKVRNNPFLSIGMS